VNKLTWIRSQGYLALHAHGELNGSALRVPSNKIIVVMNVPGGKTFTAIAAVVMQDEQLVRAAERGRLVLYGKHIYTRTYLPGEKMPDIMLDFVDDDSLHGLFRVPRQEVIVGDGSFFPTASEMRAKYDHTDLMHQVDPRYVGGGYETTLRTVVHAHTPPGVYLVTACRGGGGVGPNELGKIQDINFRKTFVKFTGGTTNTPGRVDWPPRTAAQIAAYRSSLLFVSTACATKLVTDRSYNPQPQQQH
jgi:hypothetical protein